MRTIDVPELGCKAIIVDCEDERLLLIDAALAAVEREKVMRDVLAAS
jgi:hypothetical protein